MNGAMELSKKQFDILTLLVDATLSQRELEEKTGYSLGTVNKVVKELNDYGYLSGGKITENGLLALEPYRVKKAVFLAAGFGSRLAPITLNTPKPLIRVNGVRIIDALIDACLDIGIKDIYIVRGYLAEQFDQLLYKYPMIKFLENPSYNESNNISSAMCVRYNLSNAYVFEADLLMKNPKILSKYHYYSDFLAIKKSRVDDWCFEEKNGFITEEKFGGLNCYQMVGISYWNDEDGRKLSEGIEKTYEMPGGKERFWEQVPLVVFKDNYKVQIKECSENDIVEIDTFNELKALDKSYDM